MKKYYARIIGYKLLNYADDGYWNYNGSLYIDDSWDDNEGYKKTLMTKEEWNELGINETNAVFRDTPE